MPIYSMACMRDRTEPLDEPERTQLEWMGECRHCAACARAYKTFVDVQTPDEAEAMAERLDCAECEEWDG